MIEIKELAKLNKETTNDSPNRIFRKVKVYRAARCL
jgi:hypothetical protein